MATITELELKIRSQDEIINKAKSEIGAKETRVKELEAEKPILDKTILDDTKKKLESEKEVQLLVTASTNAKNKLNELSHEIPKLKTEIEQARTKVTRAEQEKSRITREKDAEAKKLEVTRLAQEKKK